MVEREPTVLDYFKAKLMPWKGVDFEIKPREAREEYEGELKDESDFVYSDASGLTASSSIETFEESLLKSAPVAKAIIRPWRSLVALAMALIAQRMLEPPDRHVAQGIAFYAVASIWLIWALWRREWVVISQPEEKPQTDPLTVRLYSLGAGILLSVLAFLAFGGNRFTLFNVMLWLSGLTAIIYSLWMPKESWESWLQRFIGFIKRPFWRVEISRWTLFFTLAACLAIFYRVFQLNQVPPEMFSDHAEKLLDVQDVLNGRTRIFFPRNTGREAIQIYLTAGVTKYLGTGLSFTSLKIGTILAGLLSLPFIYLLGKEVSNGRTGLFAMAFAGIAYWPNVISRVGLRFPLYPLFVAPMLFYIFRGLRTSNRNDFIFAGLALGFSLHGYSTTRILPFVVIAAFLVYLFHKQSRELREQAVWYLTVVVLVSLVVFLPLGRFALENPQIFNYRTLTRLGDLERPLPGPIWQIFLNNLWNAMMMFFWSNGDTWVHSVVNRPALDVVSAALLFLSAFLFLVRYYRERRWSDLFLLLSVPLLMLPSILSLAFPNENPSLNRSGGAIIPVFVMIGYGLDSFLTSIKSRIKGSWGSRVAWGLVVLLIIWSSVQNYDLVFRQYYRQFLFSSWNTTELGQVIRSFADSIGAPDSAWVVPYPHWVDTRLVGINAGYPIKDYALWPDDFQNTLDDPRAKLFLVKPEDTNALAALREFYPDGSVSRYESNVEAKDFLIFSVPPQ